MTGTIRPSRRTVVRTAAGVVALAVLNRAEGRPAPAAAAVQPARNDFPARVRRVPVGLL